MFILIQCKMHASPQTKDLYRVQSERLSKEPGRKGKISINLNMDPSQRSGDNGNKWRITSL